MVTWVRACEVDDVDPEDVIPFAHEGADYALYRAPDGEFFATDGHCTHAQVLLCDGFVIDDVIECPKHNGRFDYRTGAAVATPAQRDLQTYPTKVEAGEVYVGLTPSEQPPEEGDAS